MQLTKISKSDLTYNYRHSYRLDNGIYIGSDIKPEILLQTETSKYILVHQKDTPVMIIIRHIEDNYKVEFLSLTLGHTIYSLDKTCPYALRVEDANIGSDIHPIPLPVGKDSPDIYWYIEQHGRKYIIIEKPNGEWCPYKTQGEE